MTKSEAHSDLIKWINEHKGDEWIVNGGDTGSEYLYSAYNTQRDSVAFFRRVYTEENGDKMKTIYIAGPYSGTDDQIKTNVANAIIASEELAKAGVCYLCPHSNGFPNEHLGLPYQYWIRMTLELCSRCDAVLVIGDYMKSSGTKGEIHLAYTENKPVFYNVKDAIAWANS